MEYFSPPVLFSVLYLFSVFSPTKVNTHKRLNPAIKKGNKTGFNSSTKPHKTDNAQLMVEGLLLEYLTDPV